MRYTVCYGRGAATAQRDRISEYPLEGRTSAGSSTGATTRRTEAAWAPAICVAVLGLLTLLEGVEAVGEGEHAVASQRVVVNILDVVTGYVAEDVLLLSQDVIDRKGY